MRLFHQGSKLSIFRYDIHDDIALIKFLQEPIFLPLLFNLDSIDMLPVNLRLNFPNFLFDLDLQRR